ncbi:pantothenate kinase [Tyzzerella sp. An114]|uniref:type III pantothenate kinase n=1 Tax=Tyzzerella sp. An114 TaxID=1965545 RepID=UPI000B432170|nr:type III pantothenate kinase [Tyzzerella sp. An114]OUQ59131.1 pantothenate kinase [Tyzzerella sp. An114]
MILVIDIGNTNSVLGVYEGEKLIARWRMTTTNTRTADETGQFIHSLFDYSDVSADSIDNIIISSVVPDIMYSITQGIRRYFNIEPMIVNPSMETGIKLNMDNPREMGADRIVNLVAANEIYKGPVLVIDYSTATTFDVIDEEGNFITGITAPGIQVCADALYERAAQLPKIAIEKPKSVITKNTVGCIQAGLVFGHIGETVYIVNKIKEELNMPNLKVVATGGLARVIDPDGSIFDVLDPYLTLKGLRILYEKNIGNKSEI